MQFSQTPGYASAIFVMLPFELLLTHVGIGMEHHNPSILTHPIFSLRGSLNHLLPYVLVLNTTFANVMTATHSFNCI